MQVLNCYFSFLEKCIAIERKGSLRRSNKKVSPL